MSGVQEGRERGFLSAADYSGHVSASGVLQPRFAKLDAAQNKVVVATAGTDNVIGVLTNAPKSGYEAAVTLLNGQGTAYITASAAIAQGAFVTATTGGKAVATTTSGDTVCGVALEAASGDGHVIEIMLTRFKY